MKDFSFQGRIELGTRLAGPKPGKLFWVGDQSSCDLTFETDTEDRTETYSGNRLQSAQLTTATRVSLELVLRYGTAENLQLGLYATPNNVAGASVMDEPLPDALAAGDRIVLAKGANVSALTLNDATPAPVDSGDFVLENAAGGIVRIIDPTGYTQPLTADYTHEAFISLPFFTAPPPERYLYLHGINTLDNSPVRLHLYRVKFQPIASLPLINSSFGEISLTGTALFDSEGALDPTLGGFGRMEIPQES
ncbi:hypothetical protein [Marilutibacter aestuarii]|uniref:Uncharacterized protein n=1 Tax=Marilutibacter aestuarii TaxID=1706195 RepID=A0A508ANA3_9GAMM|nr:hypothetical protein [Lysobacter aestuarii]TQD51239.1 hypothetical protein FKV25_02065 [Lysobacter aestuarii]